MIVLGNSAVIIRMPRRSADEIGTSSCDQLTATKFENSPKTHTDHYIVLYNFSSLFFLPFRRKCHLLQVCILKFWDYRDWTHLRRWRREGCFSLQDTVRAMPHCRRWWTSQSWSKSSWVRFFGVTYSRANWHGLRRKASLDASRVRRKTIRTQRPTLIKAFSGTRPRSLSTLRILKRCACYGSPLVRTS
jgi:hypothetical protein